MSRVKQEIIVPRPRARRVVHKDYTYEPGYGAHVVLDTGAFPCTIRAVLENGRKLLVTFDRVKIGNRTGRTLFIPLVNYKESQLRVFTRRSDGSYRLRGGRWPLKPGRHHAQ